MLFSRRAFLIAKHVIHLYFVSSFVGAFRTNVQKLSWVVFSRGDDLFSDRDFDACTGFECVPAIPTIRGHVSWLQRVENRGQDISKKLFIPEAFSIISEARRTYLSFFPKEAPNEISGLGIGAVVQQCCGGKCPVANREIPGSRGIGASRKLEIWLKTWHFFARSWRCNRVWGAKYLVLVWTCRKGNWKLGVVDPALGGGRQGLSDSGLTRFFKMLVLKERPNYGRCITGSVPWCVPMHSRYQVTVF